MAATDRSRFPHAEQQHFSACRILKHVVRARKAFHFIKPAGADLARRRTLSEKLMQFSNRSREWFRRSSTRAVFWNGYHIMFLRHIQLIFPH